MNDFSGMTGEDLWLGIFGNFSFGVSQGFSREYLGIIRDFRNCQVDSLGGVEG